MLATMLTFGSICPIFRLFRLSASARILIINSLPWCAEHIQWVAFMFAIKFIGWHYLYFAGLCCVFRMLVTFIMRMLSAVNAQGVAHKELLREELNWVGMRSYCHNCIFQAFATSCAPITITFDGFEALLRNGLLTSEHKGILDCSEVETIVARRPMMLLHFPCVTD
jgi:hypothetical protein